MTMWCCWGSVLAGEHICWTNFKLNIDNYAILNGYAPNLDDYAFVIFNGLMKFTLWNSNRMNWNNILNSIFDFLIQPLNNLISVILCFCLLYKPWLTQIQTDIRPFHTQNSYKICLNMKFSKMNNIQQHPQSNSNIFYPAGLSQPSPKCSFCSMF